MKVTGSDIVARAAQIKPGVQTTEFWTHTVLPWAATIAAAVFGLPAAPVAAVVAGMTTVAYGVGRVVLKARAGDTAGAVAEAASDVAEVVGEVVSPR